ncbi:MAG: cobalamin biosynthesis protein, partial [Aquamicrobium sp.]|uniref:cobalamin biosynthesis protein CobD/CbiB n=1 Tax=Aquamicrobium sp. TaxID=1872579 RepID=UPI00349EDA96|nr:cobalamin biosynthesis protein [Aquamicrobium sp.]
MFVLLACLALLAEAAIGYPDRLFRAIGHPVTWIGRLIAFLDGRLNDPAFPAARRRAGGVLTVAVLVLAAGIPAWGVQTALGGGVGLAATALIASSLFAQRSLGAHVGAVATALEAHGLDAGRDAVSRIVGRDPQALDEAAVCRAAIESLAENFSDGVVAPAFWLAAGGLPGCAAYKAINTADSMIGHRTPRHEAFGWAAARLDDLVNLPASRLTALLVVAACPLVRGASAGGAWRAVRRDAR